MPYTVASPTLALKFARAGCDYVLNKKGMQGANWDQYTSAVHSWESCIGRFGPSKCKPKKDKIDICVYDVVRPKVRKLTGGATDFKYIKTIADVAQKNGCGNCGEFSAVAFMYLYKKGVRPLDWMQLTDADHAFLVIGRASGNENDLDSWGRFAAVCDPWGQGFTGKADQGTYPGTKFKKKMSQLLTFKGVDSIYRAYA